MAAPHAWARQNTWVTLRLTGGFAGFDREIGLEQSGAATVTDRRSKRVRTVQVAAADLARIETLIANAGPPAPAPSCPDCLTYHLEFERNGRRLMVRVNEPQQDGGPIHELVVMLSRLLNQLLMPPA